MAPELVLFNVVLSGACGCSNIYPGRPCLQSLTSRRRLVGLSLTVGKRFEQSVLKFPFAMSLN